MDMFEYGKALADLWTLGGKAFLSSQDASARAFTESMKAAATAGGLALVPNLQAETAELSKASQAVADLWASASKVAAGLAEKFPQADDADPVIEATFRKMLDPLAWFSGARQMDEMLERVSAGPRLADLWDVERKYARVFQAWLKLRRRSLEHNAVVLRAWVRAEQKFTEQLGRLTTDGQAPDARKMLALWTETANSTLLDTQRSGEFLETQAQLLKASTQLRLAQRDLVEYYGERFGFPTRRELDDVHRAVTDLRREVRALKRQSRPGAARLQAASSEEARS